MVKKATLANYYSSEELKQKYKKSQDAVESRRWHLLWKVSLGWTIKESAIAVGISYEYGKEIIKKYNDLGEKGVENLKNKNREHRGAKQPLLTEEDLKKLSQELESRPLEQEEFIKTLPKKVKRLEEEHPDSEIELWFFDEHRVGLKPILRKVWSKIGERARARVEHRYQWLYVYGFVQPKTGKTLWYLIPRVNTQWLNLVLKNFAEEAEISATKKSY